MQKNGRSKQRPDILRLLKQKNIRLQISLTVYLHEIEKKNPKRFVDVKKLLNWWRGEIGPYLLSDLTRALIIEQRDKLLSSRARGIGQRSPATVNRYMMALDHALTIAANEWEWIHENPMKKISNLPEPRGRVRFLDDEERLAIAEYDGHQPRFQAERIAYLNAFVAVLVTLPHEDSSEDWLDQRLGTAKKWLLDQGLGQPK